jgi:hypothetical protein
MRFGWFKELSWKLKFTLILALPLVAFLALMIMLNAFNYSVGVRTGILMKLSRKGIACWTTEGELALPGFAKSGSLRRSDEMIGNSFYFSVPDPDVRKQLEETPPGSPVTLQYHQKLFSLSLPLPFFCVRRTEYEIVGVKPAPAYPAQIPMPARP